MQSVQASSKGNGAFFTSRRLQQAILDYEQSLFVLGPSGKTPETRK